MVPVAAEVLDQAGHEDLAGHRHAGQTIPSDLVLDQVVGAEQYRRRVRRASSPRALALHAVLRRHVGRYVALVDAATDSLPLPFASAHQVLAGNDRPTVGHRPSDHVCQPPSCRTLGPVWSQRHHQRWRLEVPDLRSATPVKWKPLAAVAGLQHHRLALKSGSVASRSQVCTTVLCADRCGGSAPVPAQSPRPWAWVTMKPLNRSAEADHHHGGVDGFSTQTSRFTWRCRGGPARRSSATTCSGTSLEMTTCS